jgi:hypothetical protein
MRFIRNWVSEYKSAPQFARKSWRPLRDMLEEVSNYEITQFSLDDR